MVAAEIRTHLNIGFQREQQNLATCHHSKYVLWQRRDGADRQASPAMTNRNLRMKPSGRH